MNLEKSMLRGEAPQELLVKIQHRESALIQTMLIVAIDGGEQQQTVTYDTIRGESTNVVGGQQVQSRASWNDSELVIESVLKTPNRTFHLKDHWSLAADGQTPRMAHVDDDRAGQVAVLEKAPPELASRFKPQ